MDGCWRPWCWRPCWRPYIWSPTARQLPHHLPRQLAQANGRLQEAERRLKEVTEENYQLKVYLSSKNCGWREDFARFKQRPRFACTVQPVCTGIKRQTDGGPIFIRLATLNAALSASLHETGGGPLAAAFLNPLQFLLRPLDGQRCTVYTLLMTEERKSGQGVQPYISTGEAARILGVSREAVWQNVQRGRLPSMKVGRNWIIPRDTLLEFAKTYVKGPGHRKPKTQERRQT